jgi:hypothetical protein
MTEPPAGGSVITPPTEMLQIGTAPSTLLLGTSGYVALLDVLGFRGLIGNDRDNSAILRYLGTVELCLENSGIEGIIFSDSIVLTKRGAEPQHLHALCMLCSRLMFELIRVNIPIRGAISYGDFVRSHFGNSIFLAGKPIVEAYDYEKNQDWVGVVLTRSALNAAQAVDFPSQCTTYVDNTQAFTNANEYLKWKGYVQRCAHIPFHGGTKGERDSHDGFAVVPGGSTSFHQMVLKLNMVLERIEWLKMLAPTPGDQRKYVGTMEWLRSIRDTWQSRATEEATWAAAGEK